MSKKFFTQKSFYFILLILVVAIFFRFWQIDQIPPGLYPDVAMNGNDALGALKTHDFKLFYPENNGREGLFINLIALSFWLFGVSILSIKIVPAVIGVLTVLGLYLFAKALFYYLGYQKRHFIALLSAFLLAIGFWHVNFSRLGFRAILVPFILAWSFYFLFKALNAIRISLAYRQAGESRPNDPNIMNGQTGVVVSLQEGLGADGQALNENEERMKVCSAAHCKILIYLILSGLIFGLGFHTYISYRTAPLILLPVLFFIVVAYWPKFKMRLAEKLPFTHLVKKVYLSDSWWRWDIFFIAIIVAALPIGVYFLQHPQDFLGRAGQVSVFSSASPAKALLTSTVKTLGMFNVYGDANWRHNYAGQPELLWPVGIFFIVGFFFALFQAFRPANYKQKKWPALTAYWTLLFMFGAMLLPEILSLEGVPHALRAIGAIVPVFIFAGLGIFIVYEALKKIFFKDGKKLFALNLLLAAFLIVLAGLEFNKYFLDWGQKKVVQDNFTQTYLDIGNYLNSLPSNIKKFALVNEDGVRVPYPDGIPMPAQTVIFVTQGKSAVSYLVPDLNSSVNVGSGPSVFVPLKRSDAIFSLLKQRLPQGTIENFTNFSVFKIGF